jgi:adenylate kinase
MRIVFIGPPGAGKGTQSARLARYLNIPHLSTGEILRSARKAGTDLGKIVGPIMDSGGLVGDELMLDVVAERLVADDCANGFLLDGFPRTVPQAKAFDQFLASKSMKIDHVIEMRVADVEIIKRLEARFRDLKDPRADDHPESIPRRLHVYHTETSPLLGYYSRRGGVLKKVDGLGTVDTVFDRILLAIGKGIPHPPLDARHW